MGNETRLEDVNHLELEDPARADGSTARQQHHKVKDVIGREGLDLAPHGRQPLLLLGQRHDLFEGAQGRGGVLHEIQCVIHAPQLQHGVQFVRHRCVQELTKQGE